MMEILDASAILAFIRKEKNSDSIVDLINGAEKRKESVFMHHVNYVEFLYRVRRLYAIDEFNSIVADLQTPFFGVVNYFDSELGFYSSYLKGEYHLSLGDAIGLAFTKIMNGRFWTSDRALEQIANKERIRLKMFRSALINKIV